MARVEKIQRRGPYKILAPEATALGLVLQTKDILGFKSSTWGGGGRIGTVGEVASCSDEATGRLDIDIMVDPDVDVKNTHGKTFAFTFHPRIPETEIDKVMQKLTQ